MYFSSRDPNCKSIFGALETGQPCIFTVFAPEAQQAFLLLEPDGGQTRWMQLRPGADGRFFITQTFDRPGLFFYRFVIDTPGGRQTFGRRPDGAADPAGTPWQQTVYMPWQQPQALQQGILYQIFPDRFYKAGALCGGFDDRFFANWGEAPSFVPVEQHPADRRMINNDYFGGNLRGITEKLPYLQSLGVSAIYLNPIFEAHSNHRYNTADYHHIDPTLGDEQDFQRLCRRAHQLGIRIILDGVFSHTGSDSVYFNKEGRYGAHTGAYRDPVSRYRSWFHFNRYPDDYSAWWGFETLPETNELDEDFCRFITGENGVIRRWMRLGADGWRLDVADELPDGFIEKIRQAIKAEKPAGVLYGEVWEDASNKISYDARRRFLYGAELDSVMNYPWREAILAFVRGGSGILFMDAVLNLLENYPKPAVDLLMNLLGTHDTERVLTALAGEPENGRGRDWQAAQRLTGSQLQQGFTLLKLATVLQYTLPGIPCVYYGDELLAQGYRDPFNRQCMDWEQAEQGCPSLEWYRFLGRLRRQVQALQGGRLIPAQYDGQCASYLRVGDDELFVAVNPSDSEARVFLPPDWQDDRVLLGPAPRDDALLLPPKSAGILYREPARAQRLQNKRP